MSINVTVERHIISVLVDDEPGVLARVVGLFSGRGYNIESLTVAETDHTGHRSRITVVTVGTPEVIEQIKAQLVGLPDGDLRENPTRRWQSLAGRPRMSTSQRDMLRMETVKLARV